MIKGYKFKNKKVNNLIMQRYDNIGSFVEIVFSKHVFLLYTIKNNRSLLYNTLWNDSRTFLLKIYICNTFDIPAASTNFKVLWRGLGRESNPSLPRLRLLQVSILMLFWVFSMQTFYHNFSTKIDNIYNVKAALLRFFWSYCFCFTTDLLY